MEFTDSPMLNTDSTLGEFMLTILAAVAQPELATIKESQRERIALAKKRGVYERSPKLAAKQIRRGPPARRGRRSQGRGGPGRRGKPPDSLHSAQGRWEVRASSRSLRLVDGERIHRDIREIHG